ncbi:hypothetical protein A6M27_02815 [Acidithiobacillus thiooxidans]|uniref:Uncharacterized protein n=1 Tax=Acidithiobacillus thiooxidans TaxID=930 RepID=A0A1C2IJZ0_ACITH|nr:hypothetical protein [Acidithiobacillus thiooxidans]OCX72283.1 hypothetical protein A6O24_14175 [Acidithiobacillus thiooxidans]OCX76248.1 hypothetical protein A6P07_02835 [Acidithiobacillus thiooxidans]OCX78500.1 hypothetical protein A6O26_18125 [Acidithiobacillus thiooxidans]OCX89281.1 hypothetical protein A6M27_02815 [Acidithiobacillus thiooxidans]OFC49109.1 hypothetical protein BAE47_06020 [Acidithiobacillus thiooxidans]
MEKNITAYLVTLEGEFYDDDSPNFLVIEATILGPKKNSVKETQFVLLGFPDQNPRLCEVKNPHLKWNCEGENDDKMGLGIQYQMMLEMAARHVFDEASYHGDTCLGNDVGHIATEWTGRAGYLRMKVAISLDKEKYLNDGVYRCHPREWLQKSFI